MPMFGSGNTSTKRWGQAQASFTNTLTTISKSLCKNDVVDPQWTTCGGEFGIFARNRTFRIRTLYKSREIRTLWCSP